MPHYDVTRRMAFEPAFLYAIAADVGSYDQFLPLCEASRVWDFWEGPTGHQHFRAELLIIYPKLRLRETFASTVTCDPDRLMVRAQSSEGAVKHLDCRWRFHAVNGGCDVEFFIDYDMVSLTLNLAMSTAFDYAMRKVMTAFEERARELAITMPAAGTR